MTTDEDLFREWQGGSAGALEALVGRYHAPLLAHLYRLTGDRQLAEDFAQETFLRLVRGGSSYRYPRPFAPWLYTIARNVARSDWQSGYRRRVIVGLTIPEQHASEPDGLLERLEGVSLLRGALEQLTFEQREVLSLRYGEDMPVTAVANTLGLPVGTVKSRTFNALRRLRELVLTTDYQAQERRDDEQSTAYDRGEYDNGVSEPGG